MVYRNVHDPATEVLVLLKVVVLVVLLVRVTSLAVGTKMGILPATLELKLFPWG